MVSIETGFCTTSHTKSRYLTPILSYLDSLSHFTHPSNSINLPPNCTEVYLGTVVGYQVKICDKTVSVMMFFVFVPSTSYHLQSLCHATSKLLLDSHIQKFPSHVAGLRLTQKPPSFSLYMELFESIILLGVAYSFSTNIIHSSPHCHPLS